MYEAIIFVAGVTTGVLFKEQILGFRGKCRRAYEAAKRAYNQ